MRRRGALLAALQQIFAEGETLAVCALAGPDGGAARVGAARLCQPLAVRA